MPIQIVEFGGVVPRTNPERLPDQCAQEAFNCNLTAGSLGPLRVRGDFVSMHNDDLTLKSGLPANDVIQITKPEAPSVNQVSYLAHPGTWLRVFASDWISYTDNDGNRRVSRARAQQLQLVNVVYSEAEIFLVYYLPVRIYVFPYGGPYFLRGPRYQFAFEHAVNGPDQTLTYPITVSEGDPEFTDMRAPLVDENSQIYAYFQVVDVSGPRYDEDILVTDYAYLSWIVPGSYVAFRVNMNYVNARRQHLYYVQSMVTANEQEGPPSEISDRIVLLPGQKLKLNTPFASGYHKNRLYRAGTQDAADFKLVDDIDASTYTDWRESTRPDPIPPFGNHPGARDTFLQGSVLHPNQFGVALYNGVLYASDQFRFHAWPDEYTIPFPGAKAIALTGNGILVFTADEVFLAQGGNPAALAKYFVTNNAPLLNPAGLCRIGNTVYWPTSTGLAASNGGEVEIVTDGHYTQEQWLALDPDKMIAKTKGKSIYLEYESFKATRPHIRFDIGEKLSAVATYQSLTTGQYRWHSKRFYFDQPTIIDYVRVVADGSVALDVYADRKLVQTLTIDTDEPVALNSFVRTSSTRERPIWGNGDDNDDDPDQPAVRHAHEWSFRVRGESTVRRLEAYERVVHTVTEEIRLSADNTPVWRSTFLKFTDADRWALFSLSVQTTLPVWFRLYADGALVHEVQVRSGRATALPRTLPKATLWVVDVDSPVRVDELYLTRRRTIDAGDGIREINDGPYAPWLTKRYAFTNERMVRSVLVHATKAVTMNLYYDGAVEPSESIAITPGVEALVPLTRHNTLEFDFAGDDAAVTEVIAFVSRVQAASQEGIVLVNPPSTRGLLYKFADVGVFACFSIGASDYSTLTLTLRVDGSATAVYSAAVTHGRVIALPHDLPDATLWEIDIQGGGEINSVILIPRVPELLQGRTLYVAHPRTVAPWFFKRYEFAAGATRLVSAWVEATDTIKMRLYLDGATTPSKTITLVPRVETLLDLTADCTRVEFDFLGDDDKIIEMGLFGREVKQAELSGIQEGARQNWRKLAYRFVDRADIAAVVVGARAYTGVRLAVRNLDTVHAQQLYNAAVTDARLIKMPRKIFNASLWEVDLQAPTIGVVESLIVIPRRAVQAAGRLQLTRTEAVPRWIFERYEFTQRTQIRSIAVDADDYPVKMRLYYDRSTGISKTITITNNREVLVNGPVCSCLEFDFLDDGAVRDVAIYPAAEQLTQGGIQLAMPDSWRGLKYKFADRGNWACGSIGATTYPVTVELAASDTDVYSASVADGKVFRFPRGMTKASQWTIDVVTTGIINSLVLLPWERLEVAGAAIRAMRQENGIPPWFHTIYQVPNTVYMGAAVVIADAYPITMRLYLDGAADPSATVTIESDAEIRIPNLGLANEVTFDFVGDDYLVSDVSVYLKQVQQLQGPAQFAGSLRRNLVRFAEPNAFACGLVTATHENDGPWAETILRLYADGALVRTSRLRGPGVFTLPRTLARATVWEIDLETAERATSVVLWPWERVASIPDVVMVRDHSSIPAWLYTEFVMQTPWTVASATLDADREVPIDLYLDGVKTRALLTPGQETRLPAGISGKTLRFDFDGRDQYVEFIHLFQEQAWPVDNGGVILRPAQGRPGWRNKRLEFKDTGSWNVGRVVASEYPVTLRLYRGTVEMESVTVTGPDDFKFKRDLPTGKEWALDVETTGDIYELVLIARELHPIANGAVRIERPQDPYSWLGNRVFSPRPIDFSACRIAADQYPVRLRLYLENVKQIDILVMNDRAFRLPRRRPGRLWEFDIVAGEGTLIHEVVLATSMDGIRG